MAGLCIYCIYYALFGVGNLGTLAYKPLNEMAHDCTRLNEHVGEMTYLDKKAMLRQEPKHSFSLTLLIKRWAIYKLVLIKP